MRKVSKDIRMRAGNLFRASFVNGQLDESRVRQTVQTIVASKPRKLSALLSWYKELVSLEIEKRTVKVESATALEDKGAAVFEQIEKKFGTALERSYQQNQSLIGGLRITTGFDVWDGSVRHRLEQL